MSDEKSLKGTWAELKAASKYTKLGFYVSKPFDPHCPFDLVVTNRENGESFLVDVKTTSIRKTDTYNCKKGDRINRVLNKMQKKMGVRLLYIQWEMPDGKAKDVHLSEVVHPKQ